MDDPRLVQTSIYGAGRRAGPPMLYEVPLSKAPRRPFKRRKLTPPQPSTDEILRDIKTRQRVIQADESLLSACDLPGDFPPELAFRSLAAYSLLRTLSVTLRLSPFTPNVFLRALYLPYPNKVMGQVHVALLRILLPHLHLGYSYKSKGLALHKRRSLDNIRIPLRGGDNLTYLDGFSWPLFYDDYCNLTADRLFASYHDEGTHLDFRLVGMQPVDTDNYEFDYPAFGDNDDDDEDEDEHRARMAASSSASASTSESLRLLLQLQQQQRQLLQPPAPAPAPPQPLGRGQRGGHNQGAYQGMDQSDSDSEYGDDGEEEDDDSVEYRSSSWRRGPRGRRRGNSNKKPKRNTPSQTQQQRPATTISATLSSPPAVPALPETKKKTPPTSGSKVMDLEVPVCPSMDPATATKAEIPQFNDLKVGSSVTKDLFRDSQSEPQPKSAPLQDMDYEKHEAKEKYSSQLNTVESSSSKVSPEENSAPIQPQSGLKGNNRRRLPISGKSPPSSEQTHSGSNYSSKQQPRPKLPLSSDTLPQKSMLHGQSHFLQMAEALKAQQLQQMTRMQNPGGQNKNIAMSAGGLNLSQAGGVMDAYALSMRQRHHQHQQLLLQQMAILSSMASANRSAPASKPPQSEPKRKGLEVEDDVAKALRGFMCGAELESPDDTNAKERTTNPKDTTDDFEQKMYDQQWIHFQPLKKLRAGVPYFRLSPKDKVIMLEFLIDQLLSIEGISAEFSTRKAVGDCYTVPYGAWPTNEEFENLDNGDECGVCGGEGELLCCDGCVSSYHRGCLDMTMGQQLPDGKWLCPECRVVDPAFFGPLRGGAKASLDWVSVDDIQESLKMEELRRQSILNAEYLSQTPYTMPGGSRIDLWRPSAFPSHHPQEGTTSMLIAGGTQSTAQGVMSLALPEEKSTIASMTEGKEFLVVHGFVFSRSEDRAESSPLVLSKDVVKQILDQMDPAIKKAWPLVQIPNDGDSTTVHFPPLRQYLMPLESFDPNMYSSKYSKAPIPLWMSAGGGAQVPKLMTMDFESECTKSSTYRVSDSLIRDFSVDVLISKNLRSEAVLFDPYNLFKGYMSRLEIVLRKACLVNEFWEAGTEKTKHEKWRDNVRKARSINRLARLLLQLVDCVHSRAFEEGWFHNPHIKGDEVVTDTDRHFEDLPSDWTAKQESRKRAWEKTPEDSILRVCEKEGCSLDFFVQGIREHISRPLVASRSKRKQIKAAAPPKPEDVEKPLPGISTILEIGDGARASNAASSSSQVKPSNQNADSSIAPQSTSGSGEIGKQPSVSPLPKNGISLSTNSALVPVEAKISNPNAESGSGEGPKQSSVSLVQDNETSQSVDDASVTSIANEVPAPGEVKLSNPDAESGSGEAASSSAPLVPDNDMSRNATIKPVTAIAIANDAPAPVEMKLSNPNAVGGSGDAASSSAPLVSDNDMSQNVTCKPVTATAIANDAPAPVEMKLSNPNAVGGSGEAASSSAPLVPDNGTSQNVIITAVTEIANEAPTPVGAKQSNPNAEGGSGEAAIQSSVSLVPDNDLSQIVTNSPVSYIPMPGAATQEETGNDGRPRLSEKNEPTGGTHVLPDSNRVHVDTMGYQALNRSTEENKAEHFDPLNEVVSVQVRLNVPTPNSGTTGSENIVEDSSPVKQMDIETQGRSAPESSPGTMTQAKQPDESVVDLAVSTSNVSPDVSNNDSAAKKAERPKKKRRLDTPASSRRRTRRSAGRYAPVVTEKDTPGDAAPPQELSAKRPLTASDSIETHIEVFKLRKIPKIEKVVKGGFQKQLEWPICGRILFATMGNLPPHEMKRLGRNGGVVKAPHVAYQTSHEVGQVSFSHVWRKETEQCYDFEGLVLQLRVLESFLDRSTIQSCENVARRGKAQIQKVVKVTKRDPSNGIVEHFVVNKGKRKGCWISSQHLDVSGLILDAFGRRQKQINKRNLYLQQQEKAERDRKEKEMAKQASEMAEKRALQKAAEVRARSELAKTEAAKIQAAKELVGATINNLQKQQSFGQAKPSSDAKLERELNQWKQTSNAILMQHQVDLAELIQKCLQAGVYPIPESKLSDMRKTTMMRLNYASVTLRKRNTLQTNDEHLAKLITSCETEALQKMSSSLPANSQANPSLNEPGQGNRTSIGQPPAHRDVFNNAMEERRQQQYGNSPMVMASPSGMNGYASRETSSEFDASGSDLDDIFDSPNESRRMPSGDSRNIRQIPPSEQSGYHNADARLPSSNLHNNQAIGEPAGQKFYMSEYSSSGQNGYNIPSTGRQESYEHRPNALHGQQIYPQGYLQQQQLAQLNPQHYVVQPQISQQQQFDPSLHPQLQQALLGLQQQHFHAPGQPQQQALQSQLQQLQWLHQQQQQQQQQQQYPQQQGQPPPNYYSGYW